MTHNTSGTPGFQLYGHADRYPSGARCLDCETDFPMNTDSVTWAIGLNKHRETHTAPWETFKDPWIRHIPEGLVLGGTKTAGLRLYCAACEWEATYPCHDLRGIVATATEHRDRECHA